MPRMIDLGKTRYDWIPLSGGIANPSAPTVIELNAGKSIGPLMVQSSKVMATASDTTKERAVTDVANSETPTIGNYMGKLVLFRSGDNATGVFATDDPRTIFAEMGLHGWVVKRTGLPAAAAYAAGQSVETYLFCTDTPIPSGGEQDGNLKLEVPLLPQGVFDVTATVAA